MRKSVFRTFAVVAMLMLLALAASAADRSPNDSRENAGRYAVGVGASVSTLGIGGQFGLAVTRSSNVRVGFNAFNYGHTFDRDGIRYDGTFQLRSLQATYDIFPFHGGFHISPGLMIYNGNKITATSNVPAAQIFTLGNAQFRSSTTDPVRGNGEITTNTVAPMILFGFGNLVPRTKHFAVIFDAGVAFHGTPATTLNFTGTACDASGANCRNIATDPTLQSNVAAEQKKIDDDVSSVKVWPVISIGFGYRF